MRVYAISDLHTDFRANRLLIDGISKSEHQSDALVVAGDIADRLEIIEETLALLRSKFHSVYYTPGNHELWVRSDDCDSVEKFFKIIEMCRRLDIQTSPTRIGRLWIVPLFSWYDAQFDCEGGKDDEDLQGWADYHFCRWPADIRSVSVFFSDMNKQRVKRYDGEVISLSHFLPRRELLPKTERLRFKGLPKVAGTSLLEAQIRSLEPAVHVLGHSHIDCDRVIDGIRYVQNSLKYPQERLGSGLSLKLVWNQTSAHCVEEVSRPEETAN
jgi:predicted phosphodiesterase